MLFLLINYLLVVLVVLLVLMLCLLDNLFGFDFSEFLEVAEVDVVFLAIVKWEATPVAGALGVEEDVGQHDHQGGPGLELDVLVQLFLQGAHLVAVQDHFYHFEWVFC